MACVMSPERAWEAWGGCVGEWFPQPRSVYNHPRSASCKHPGDHRFAFLVWPCVIRRRESQGCAVIN